VARHRFAFGFLFFRQTPNPSKKEETKCKAVSSHRTPKRHLPFGEIRAKIERRSNLVRIPMPATAIPAPIAANHARTLRVLSNLPTFDAHPVAGVKLQHTFIGENAGKWAAFRIFAQSAHTDVILLDGNEPYLWLLCLLRWLWPFSRCKLVSVDIMFVKPVTVKQRLASWLMRFLLKRVDHFIHYFKDLEGYERYFGVGPDRSTFVPFKVNSWDDVPAAGELSSDGDYIFTGGRSLRDIDTFVAALRRVPYPGVLLYHDLPRMAENGTPLSLESLPANVRAVEDDGSAGSWLEQMRRAKIVVLTTLPSSIRAIGVTSYLMAMAMKKCVIITDGPATRGILHDEAILVPPGDPVALADAIERVWNDPVLRETTACKGRAYAEKLGGTERLFADILDVCSRITSPTAS
jgi:glycosyltransferase involved in cell wall biosynthesis